jgi:hypothetical protein
MSAKITNRLPNETAGWQQGARSRIGKFFGLRFRCWFCQKICDDKFFNIDASRELDLLTLEIEKLRAGGTK